MIERIESSVRCRARWPRKPPKRRHGGGEPLLRLRRKGGRLVARLRCRSAASRVDRVLL